MIAFDLPLVSLMIPLVIRHLNFKRDSVIRKDILMMKTIVLQTIKLIISWKEPVFLVSHQSSCVPRNTLVQYSNTRVERKMIRSCLLC